MEFYKIKRGLWEMGRKMKGSLTTEQVFPAPAKKHQIPAAARQKNLTTQTWHCKKKRTIRKQSRDVNITVCENLEQDAGDKEGELRPEWAAAEGGSSTSEVKAVEGSESLKKHLRGSGGEDAADWICIFTQLLLVLRLK